MNIKYPGPCNQTGIALNENDPGACLCLKVKIIKAMYTCPLDLSDSWVGIWTSGNFR